MEGIYCSNSSVFSTLHALDTVGSVTYIHNHALYKWLKMEGEENPPVSYIYCCLKTPRMMQCVYVFSNSLFSVLLLKEQWFVSFTLIYKTCS